MRLTASAICGTDLHFVRGTMSGMVLGTIVGHAGVGMVAVFGCGSVGLFAIASAKVMGAGRTFAVDTSDSRLKMARALGAEVIDFNAEDPVAVLQALTGGSGPEWVVDVVGVDANRPDHGPAAKQAK